MMKKQTNRLKNNFDESLELDTSKPELDMNKLGMHFIFFESLIYRAIWEGTWTSWWNQQAGYQGYRFNQRAFRYKIKRKFLPFRCLDIFLILAIKKCSLLLKDHHMTILQIGRKSSKISYHIPVTKNWLNSFKKQIM